METPQHPQRITEDDIKRRALLHTVSPETEKVMDEVRYHYFSLMTALVKVLPASDETRQAIDLLDTSLTKSTAALARHQGDLDVEASLTRLMESINNPQ
jgi:hypothetical protein